MDISKTQRQRPWGLKWRSSISFITAVVGVGIATDLLVYSIIIPVVPFQLERLKYHAVSALTGWLLCAYSLGLVLSTIPIASFAEKSSSRRIPLVTGLLSLLAAQILIMEAPNYAIMVVARVLQGISSSTIWVVGLALICDTTPEQNVGRQIGFAMTGLSIGLMTGTPVGGSLYTRFGFRAPFIFGEIFTLVDLLLRLLIIEKDAALKWGYDSATGQDINVVADLEASSSGHRSSDVTEPTQSALIPVHPVPEQTRALIDPKQDRSTPDSCTPAATSPTVSEISLVRKPLPMLSVIRQLGQSSRAVVALVIALAYGTVNSMQEPSIPLRLQAVWGYNSERVGLVYMAGLVPALFSSPLAGSLADRMGAEYIICICLLFTLPWWIVLVLRKSVALFIVALAVQSFFVSGVGPPVSVELAAVSRRIPGIGYAYVYGAFNLAFGVGAAVGPVIGGQVYGHTKHGWTVLCYITVAFLAICTVPVFCCTGDDPLLSKLLRRRNRLRAPPEDANPIEKEPKEGATGDSTAPTL